jgi:hypothetical protein
VFVDWQLFVPHLNSLLSPSSSQRPWSKRYPLGRRLYFKNALLYLSAILIDIIIRLFWILKITLMYSIVNHILQPKEIDSTVMPKIVVVDVSLKVLEIFRRWVWVFFRVEREWVVNVSGVATSPVNASLASEVLWSEEGLNKD